MRLLQWNVYSTLLCLMCLMCLVAAGEYDGGAGQEAEEGEADDTKAAGESDDDEG